MTETRTRARTRPSTKHTTTEARSGGTTLSEQTKDEQRPARSTRIEKHNNNLVAFVSVKDGVTLNMTDFNSFRRDIGVELPVPLGPIESIDDVLDTDGNLMPDVYDALDRVYTALDTFVAKKHDQTVDDATDYFRG